jgi:hypothetical protein
VIETKNRNLIVQAENLFAQIYHRFEYSLENRTDYPLGMDLLRARVKQDLFQTALLTTKTVFFEILKAEQISVSPPQGKKILIDIVHTCTKTFLKKYYGAKIQLNPHTLESTPYLEGVTHDADLLIAVPFSALLNAEAQIFQSTFAPIYESASVKLLEALLENLIIEITNCVMVILASDFSSVSDIRQTLYKSNFLAVRNSEHFKNKIIWQGYIRTFITRPKSLYNSEFRLFIVRPNGIYCRVIYTNRVEELLLLNKFPLLVINYIELQDFLVARSNSSFVLFGKGSRYFFTSIVGRVIGLIWKGVLEGLK